MAKTKTYSKKYNKSIKSVSLATYNKLKKYHWPGNVRELQHSVERAIILSDSQVLQPADFLFSSSEPREDGLIFDSYNLDNVEKIVIQKTLQKYGGNISKAALELGLTRASLYRRMEKYGI